MSEIIEARVPDLGSDSGVPVIELLVKVGDTVVKDQGLLTLESDKATMEVPSPVSGEIIEIVAKIGDELSNGDLVAKMRHGAPHDDAILKSVILSGVKDLAPSNGPDSSLRSE